MAPLTIPGSRQECGVLRSQTKAYSKSRELLHLSTLEAFELAAPER